MWEDTVRKINEAKSRIFPVWEWLSVTWDLSHGEEFHKGNSTESVINSDASPWAFLVDIIWLGRPNLSSLVSLYQPGLFFLPACLMVSSFFLSPCFWRVLLCYCYLCLNPSLPTSEPSFCHHLMWSKEQRLSRNPPGPDCDCWNIQPHRWSRHWILSLLSIKISMAGLPRP